MPPGMGTIGMDPSQNNQPLQFNTAKGKPPVPIVGGMVGGMEGANGDNRGTHMHS